MQRSAFTFIEVVAVVAIMAVLAGATVWAWTGQVRAATLEDAAIKLRNLDRTARLAAERTGRDVWIRFDLDRQHAWREAMDADERKQRSASVRFPAGCRIDRLRIAGTADVIESGEARIAISTAGRSATYALRLASPAQSMDATDTPAESVWLVIAGLTGEVTRGYDEDGIENLFDTLDG